MKAVILELRGPYAAALSDDGSVCRLKNRQYAVGQVIELSAGRPSTMKLWLRVVSVAAIAVFLLIPCYAYYAPYAYVSLDVNPSISYTLNRYQRVLNVSGVNEDGAELVKSLDLKNRTMEEALLITMNALADQGYFSQDQWKHILIATACADEEDSGQVADSLAMTAKKTAQEEKLLVNVDTTVVCKDLVAQAQTLGISPGKLSLIEILQEVAGEDQIHVEDWLDASVGEIISETKSLKGHAGSPSAQQNDRMNQSDTHQPDSAAQDKNSQETERNGKSGTENNAGSRPGGKSQGANEGANDKNGGGSKTAPGQSGQNGNNGNSGKHAGQSSHR